MILARPGGSSPGWSAIIRAHSRRSWNPAAVWMALSTQPWQGMKQPSMALLAALTMASTARVVMSPCHR